MKIKVIILEKESKCFVSFHAGEVRVTFVQNTTALNMQSFFVNL